MIARRALLTAAATLVLAERARAQTAQTPVIHVSHGAPLFLPDQAARRGALRAWGARLPKPRGILVMTPHFASRRMGIGNTTRGFAWYDLPGPLKRQLPQDLEYATPPSAALAEQVNSLLGARLETVEDRRGFDHTTWMPLLCLYPQADVPVLELTYPYVPEAELFALGRRLAPLRDAGVLFVASGGLTHNLAMPLEGQTPAFAREFDVWASERMASCDVDALIDWRRRAPAADLCHPDDGAHFRVALAALGVALGNRGSSQVSFPVAGFEGALSNRCVEFV